MARLGNSHSEAASPVDNCDIDQLVEHIKNQAQRNEVNDNLAIGSWIELWNTRLAPVYQANQLCLFLPDQPNFAELLSAHLDDHAFIERAYVFLLGRSPDPQGKNYYTELLRKQGRIAALVTLLQTEEVQDHVRCRGITIPSTLRVYVQTNRILSSIPLLSSLAIKGWRVGVKLSWQTQAKRWKELGRYYDFLATQAQRDDKYLALAITLQEVAEVQQRILARQNAVLSPKQKGAADLPLDAREAEQTTKILELLRRAQSNLDIRR